MSDVAEALAKLNPPIYLSPPHLGGAEHNLVRDVFSSNWIAPLGPHVDAFEKEFASSIGAEDAAAVVSGTAALHLGLRLLNVGVQDTVFVSNFTFVASVNPIIYQGATPVFIDSESESWNMDPDLLAEALASAERSGRLPKAVIVVHLYGQPASLDRIIEVCRKYNVTVVEDAAEALGASYRGRAPGTIGDFGFFSFNGNKVITTSGGGMLVSSIPGMVARARALGSQARQPVDHYEHEEIGYNYRLSNVLAAIGRGQLTYLNDRVAARRAIFQRYHEALSDVPGISFMPEAPWGGHSRWLTTLTINAEEFGADQHSVRARLAEQNIESRPLWKPMHMQPVFRGVPVYGGAVSEDLFKTGLCLPSGSAMSEADQRRVIDTILETRYAAAR